MVLRGLVCLVIAKHSLENSHIPEQKVKPDLMSFQGVISSQGLLEEVTFRGYLEKAPKC